MTDRKLDKTVRTVVPLKQVEGKIPRNSEGDPAFTALGVENADDWEDLLGGAKKIPQSLLSVFTPEQVVVLVNRQLYQMEYQYRSHRQRYDADKEMRAEVKTALNELHPTVSMAKATEQQLREAVNLVLERKGEK